MSQLIVQPAKILEGEVKLPGDKSISHRAIIFGALSHGKTVIRNLLEGDDVLRTIQIFRDLGVRIEKNGDRWVVHGKGAEGLKRSPTPLYCGNSGTTMRLMTGLLAALPFESVLTGDASLDRRPMGRVIVPLSKMGARIFEEWQEGRRFIHVWGTKLKAIRYRLPVPSAQVKSALLLAGLVAEVSVQVREPIKTRDHTERMLKLFRDRRGKNLIIPGDPSSAAFFVVAGLIHSNPKSHLLIKNLLLNPTRIGFLKVLGKMGGEIKIQRQGTMAGELTGNLTVSPSCLRAVSLGGELVPSLIDEVPILAVAASRAGGKSRFRDMKELRIKESDRISSIASEFPKFGVKVVEKKNGFEIKGTDRVQGGIGESYGDHRIAMSLAILGTAASAESLINDVDCIQTSFPSFISTLRKIGGNVHQVR
ncbi:MAG: 3-phosphoshikimate 1-carboxyvinyltransferase [Deltaproteobacteria bacterium]|nr:3-phosphoshikimate 1-carboxyvinyltransferase [Deltaproteobacteria bacterium]